MTGDFDVSNGTWRYNRGAHAQIRSALPLGGRCRPSAWDLYAGDDRLPMVRWPSSRPTTKAPRVLSNSERLSEEVR